MAQLFDSWEIGSLPLGDRLVRAATAESLCTKEGEPTKPLIELYRDLAAGGASLIITGFCSTCPDGVPAARALALWDESFETAHRELVSAVHDEGAKIFLQLVYGGSKSKLSSDDPRALPASDGPTTTIVGPSPVADPVTGLIPTEAAQADIDRIVDSFATAARLARAWGYDGVELHCAHGYGIARFLSPRTNQRCDAYGGSTDARARFAVECVKAIRRAVGPDFPVLVKIDASENYDDPAGAKGGLSEDDALRSAMLLVDAGASGVDVSGDWHRAAQEERGGQPYFGSFAERLQRMVNVPVIVTGGWRDPRIIESFLARDAVTAVGLGRPFIREPHLAQRWRDGDMRASFCIDCGMCSKQGGIPCPSRLCR